MEYSSPAQYHLPPTKETSTLPQDLEAQVSKHGYPLISYYTKTISYPRSSTIFTPKVSATEKADRLRARHWLFLIVCSATWTGAGVVIARYLLSFEESAYCGAYVFAWIHMSGLCIFICVYTVVNRREMDSELLLDGEDELG